MESETKSADIIRYRARIVRAGVLVFTIGFWVASANTNAAQDEPPAGGAGYEQPDLEAMGQLQDAEISESSGLAWAAVPGHDDAFWTINDSGHDPDLFLVASGGTTVCRLRLKKADNRDWEAMCQFDIGGVSHLAIADVGDNALKRRTSIIYVVKEPIKFKGAKEKIRSTGYEFRFGDDAVNCESVSFDRDSQSFWMIEKIFVGEKRTRPPGIFAISWQALVTFQQSDDPEKTPPIATRIGDFPSRNVTGMAFSPNNECLVARGYFMAYLFRRREGQTWADVVTSDRPKMIPLPVQSQGEAICFAGDDRHLIVTSEQVGATIWRLSLEE